MSRCGRAPEHKSGLQGEHAGELATHLQAGKTEEQCAAMSYYSGHDEKLCAYLAVLRTKGGRTFSLYAAHRVAQYASTATGAPARSRSPR